MTEQPYTIIKTYYNNDDDCLLVGTYSLDIVPASTIQNPVFTATYAQCEKMIREEERQQNHEEKIYREEMYGEPYEV